MVVDEVRIRDFRCFGDKQTARLAPLTLLVGENSTGKTSFLAAVRAIWDTAFQQIDPDFRLTPYDLGTFPEIVHSQGIRHALPESFEIGFSRTHRRGRISVDVTFTSHSAVPFPAAITLYRGSTWVKLLRFDDGKLIIDFGHKENSWRYTTRYNYPRSSYIPILNTMYLFRIRRDLEEAMETQHGIKILAGHQSVSSQAIVEKVIQLLRDFVSLRTRFQAFASAPIRSSPRRTYDPLRPTPDPEGAYIPTFLADVNFRDKEQWNTLKEELEGFGRDSGLFDDIDVKQLGKMEGGPFQLQVRKAGTRRKGRKRNLIDVGYGVSQILPVLAEIFRTHGAQMFLFQQPEVHLHPSAQAALGSLFCATAASGRQLIIETHSDYIVDRILLDVRDKRTNLKPDDVSILYFERDELSVNIHSIRTDDEGNVLNAPDGYRSFFTDELNRVMKF